MRRPWSALLLIVGGLLVLVSLYSPWQESEQGFAGGYFGPQDGAVQELLNLFSGNETVDGWSAGAGQVAGLFALLLVALGAAALARPTRAGRLPLGRCALLVVYFAVAVGAETLSVAHQRGIADVERAYGSYLGLGGAIAVLLAAGAMRRGELVQYRSVSRLPVLGLVVALLLAFLLPWERFAWPTQVTSPGIAIPAAVVAAALTLCAVRGQRLRHSAVVGLLTIAAFSSLTGPVSRAYGAWVGLGVAVALVALAVLDVGHVSRPARPSWQALATSAAAALVVTAIFLPWQEACYGTGSDFGPYSGRCVSTNGWPTLEGSVAGVLAIAVVIVAFAPRRLPVSVTELAAGVGLLVATLGFRLEDRSDPGFSLEPAYGSKIGFVGAALLVALAVARLRPAAVEWKGAAARLAPILACTGYLLVVVLPWWDVLPALSFAPLSWLTIAGALIGIRLLFLWVRQIAGAAGDLIWLVLLPIALFAIATLDLIRLREDGITWGGSIVLILCALLALLGRLEQREGLGNLHVPEILRVDRI